MDESTEKLIYINDCPRCGHAHRNVAFQEFQKPVIIGDLKPYTHWAFCWNTKEPILARIEQDGEIVTLNSERKYGDGTSGPST